MHRQSHSDIIRALISNMTYVCMRNYKMPSVPQHTIHHECFFTSGNGKYPFSDEIHLVVPSFWIHGEKKSKGVMIYKRC